MPTENLYYSPSEEIAFYIPNHYPDRLNVWEQIKMLEREAMNFARLLGGNLRLDDMQSDEIRESRRYKGMRVWWIKFNKVPEGAFVIGSEETTLEIMKRGYTREQAQWTMHKWIKD